MTILEEEDGEDAAGTDLVEEVLALRDGELRVRRPRDPEALIDERAFAREGEFLPYWAEPWPSGLALARRLSGRALRGARVVELGCGLGIPSLVAARAGGRVLATDWSAAALARLRANARENAVALETMRVDWSAPQALLDRAPFDLVLAADVLYERRNVAALLALMPRLGPEAWLADPGREFTGSFLAGIPERWREHTEVREGTVRLHRLRGRGLSS